jgi:rubrerythrin
LLLSAIYCGTADLSPMDPTAGTENADSARRSTRRALLRGGLVVGGAFAVGGGAFGWRAGAATPAPSAATDQQILNFALVLERLQAAFYTAAVDDDALRGELREFAEIVGGHEREHVAFLEKALGSNADSQPTFEFGSATREEKAFLDAAVLLENTGVAAYNGQAANLTKKSLAAAAEIVSVEGRHAAWISDLAGQHPAPRAADPGATADDVAATLQRTGFIKEQ